MSLDLVAKLVSVALAGAVEIWAAVPAGLALGLHPVLVAVATSAGGIVAVLAVSFVGEGVRARLLRGHAPSATARPGFVKRAWGRYGAPGLGLIAPLVVGAPIGTAMGLALGAPASRLRAWMSVGVVVWSTGLTALGAAALEVIA